MGKGIRVLPLFFYKKVITMGVFSSKADKKKSAKANKQQAEKTAEAAKAAETPQEIEAVDDRMIDATVSKAFTSTIFGAVAKGKVLNISKERYKTWLSQGLVDEV